MSSVAALLLALVSPGLALVPSGQGTLAQGLAEMRRLSEAEKPDEALALADRLLAPGSFAQWRERQIATPGWKRTVVEAASPLFEALGLSDLTGPERAAVHYARGVVLANAKKTAESDAALEQARALAGPGELRFDASYDLGWNALEEGEAQRAKIPELGGQAAPQAAPQAANPAAPQPPGQADPLQLARAAYTQALGRFVECLKLDARDEDTRANAELARKRLRELAEIQKKREEEKQKQEQQKKDQEKKDQDKKDQDKQDQQKKDSSEDKDKDKKNPDDQPKEDKPKDEKKKDEESDKSKQEKKEAQPQPSKEEQLTKEEIMRILDTLKDREEEGKKLLEQLRRARRAKVKRDW